MNTPEHAGAVRKRWWALMAATVAVSALGIYIMGWVPPTMAYHLPILGLITTLYWAAAWLIWRCPGCGTRLSPWRTRWNGWAAECPGCGAKLRE